MPKNLKAESCDAVVQTTLENMDWCAAAEENNCNLASQEETEVLSGETARLQEPLSSIIANQEIIYKYIQDSFADLNQSINKLQDGDAVQNTQELLIDKKEQQRLELQAQIEALQAEMANL